MAWPVHSNFRYGWCWQPQVVGGGRWIEWGTTTPIAQRSPARCSSSSTDNRFRAAVSASLVDQEPVGRTLPGFRQIRRHQSGRQGYFALTKRQMVRNSNVITSSKKRKIADSRCLIIVLVAGWSKPKSSTARKSPPPTPASTLKSTSKHSMENCLCDH